MVVAGADLFYFYAILLVDFSTSAPLYRYRVRGRGRWPTALRATCVCVCIVEILKNYIHHLKLKWRRRGGVGRSVREYNTLKIRSVT